MSLYKGKYYLFANWKMYLDYDESNIEANALAVEAKRFSPRVKMAVFPNALSLYPVAQVLRDVDIGVGAQNTHWLDKGGYTGEISAPMFKAAGCEYALIGHSERRHLFSESNDDTQKKMEAVVKNGLTPVLCVGETLQDRRDGKTNDTIEIQLRAALQGLTLPKGRALIIAYEPVWAIGSGESCNPLEAEKEHKNIIRLVRGLLPKIEPIMLYGGSVRPDNALDYLSQPSIHGVLVGGASAKLKTWEEIIYNIK